MASGNSNPTRTGAFVGTGSLITVNVGYRPKSVQLVNAGDPGHALHIDTMPDDSCFIDDGGAPAYVTSAAITLTDNGFTVGTNAALNTSGEQVFWVARG